VYNKQLHVWDTVAYLGWSKLPRRFGRRLAWKVWRHNLEALIPTWEVQAFVVVRRARWSCISVLHACAGTQLLRVSSGLGDLILVPSFVTHSVGFSGDVD